MLTEYLENEINKMPNISFRDEVKDLSVSLIMALVLDSQDSDFIEHFDEIAYQFLLKIERFKAKI